MPSKVWTTELKLHITIYRRRKSPKDLTDIKFSQISDYHADSVPGLIEEIEHESPDIIVSTGDLVHDTGSYTPGVHLCKHLIDIAPVYAVTGNHDLWRSDYDEFERELTEVGVKHCMTSVSF